MTLLHLVYLRVQSVSRLVWEVLSHLEQGKVTFCSYTTPGGKGAQGRKVIATRILVSWSSDSLCSGGF